MRTNAKVSEYLLDARAQLRPHLGFDLKMSPQIEHGLLAHLFTDTHKVDESIGEIGLIRGRVARCGLANKHSPPCMCKKNKRVNNYYTIMALQIDFKRRKSLIITKSVI